MCGGLLKDLFRQWWPFEGFASDNVWLPFKGFRQCSDNVVAF